MCLVFTLKVLNGFKWIWPHRRSGARAKTWIFAIKGNRILYDGVIVFKVRSFKRIIVFQRLISYLQIRYSKFVFIELFCSSNIIRTRYHSQDHTFWAHSFLSSYLVLTFYLCLNFHVTERHTLFYITIIFPNGKRKLKCY